MQSKFTRAITRLVVVLCAFLNSLPIAIAQDADRNQDSGSERAKALLQGAENARLSIPPGRLRISAALKDIAGTNAPTLDVLFDGWRRRFDSTLSGDVVTKTIVTEADLIHFDGDNSCTLQHPQNALTAYCFDPRTLGITSSYLLEDTVESCLAYRGAKSISLIGTEVVNGHKTSHVSVEDRYGQQVDFWIENTKGFPVHKYQFRTPSGLNRAVSISTYDAGKMGEPIPVRVETTGYHNDQIIEQRAVTVLNADFDVEIDSGVWELAGLGLPIGTPVSDLRLKQRIGYWNGEGLSKNVPPVPFTTQSTWGYWSIVGIGAGILVLAIALLAGRRLWRRA